MPDIRGEGFAIGESMSGVALELPEGKSWTDAVSVDMTYEQCAAAFVIISSQMLDMEHYIDEAKVAFRKGDRAAGVAARRLSGTASDLQGAMRSLARILMPDLMNTLDEQERATEALYAAIRQRDKANDPDVN